MGAPVGARSGDDASLEGVFVGVVPAQGDNLRFSSFRFAFVRTHDET